MHFNFAFFLFSSLPNCPLFQDTDDYLNFKELEPKDPYYEVKREEVVKKVRIIP